MDQAWDRGPGPRPSTARIRVRELSWQGLHNPCPQSQDPGGHGRDHGKQLLEEYLSPARLHALAQADDLGLVSRLELRVNTRENSLGNFGVHLPNLSQLKLNGSCLGSLRTALTSQPCPLQRPGHLPGPPAGAVAGSLWPGRPGRCQLLPGPQGTLRFLQRHLGPEPAVPARAAGGAGPGGQLRGGPGAAVLSAAVPEAGHAHPGGQPRVPAAGPRLLQRDHPYGSPSRRLGPDPCLPEIQPRAPRPWPLSLLVPGGPLPEDLLPKSQAPEDHASNLTHGTGRVLCGNPSKGLQERRHQGQAWVHPEKLPPYRPEGLATRASSPAPDPADSCDLLARLQALRELCMRPLPHRCLESQKAVATVPGGPQRGPEEQEDKAGPKTPPRPSSLGTEPSRTVGYNLIPSPPKSLMSPDRGSSSLGSTDLQFRGRRLRALGSLGPGRSGGLGLGRGLAAVSALRALEVASGSSPSAKGRPGPKPAPDPAARPPASSACHT
ncbi:leucine-rich repeat-containing protein 56 isoform X3 [Camelus bactrianus]|uniref:Leucine-rich repeat-containing protein 56 isoform X3 n=1 Tax=Camelus bactrianus TaxID=9837 RepID=A0AC58QYN2_CAMBA